METTSCFKVNIEKLRFIIVSQPVCASKGCLKKGSVKCCGPTRAVARQVVYPIAKALLCYQCVAAATGFKPGAFVTSIVQDLKGELLQYSSAWSSASVVSFCAIFPVEIFIDFLC